MTVLAASQLRIDLEDPEGTRQAVVAGVEQAAQAGAEIVVLPELALTGYVFADAAEAASRAEDTTGSQITLLRSLAARHGLVLVAGWCERSGGERPYNSAVVIDAGNLVASYRKTHLWGSEKDIFTPGDRPPPVVQTRHGRIAPLICYDLEFPELVGAVARADAQLIAVPANWPRCEVPNGQRPIELTKAQAFAAVNRVVIVVADRCGTERGISWIGGSLICGPDGYLVAGPAAGEEELLVADVDLEATRDKRLGPHNDALADRRPSLYSAPPT